MIFVLAGLIGTGFWLTQTNEHEGGTEVGYSKGFYSFDITDDRKLVGVAHNVFVGKVIAQTYLDDQGIYLNRGVKSGSLSYTISEIEEMIDDGRPFYLTEESRWGTCHAVVLRGYYDALITSFFMLNDPNTLTGTNAICWYNTDNTLFNYEENVYEYAGSTDTSSTGYSYLG